MEPIKADGGRAGLSEFNCLVQQSQAHLNLRGHELDKPDSLANNRYRRVEEMAYSRWWYQHCPSGPHQPFINPFWMVFSGLNGLVGPAFWTYSELFWIVF